MVWKEPGAECWALSEFHLVPGCGMPSPQVTAISLVCGWGSDATSLSQGCCEAGPCAKGAGMRVARADSPLVTLPTQEAVQKVSCRP